MSVTFHRNFALLARLEKRIKFSSTSNSLDSGRQQSSYNATCTWCMFYSSAPVQSIRRLNLFQSRIIILIGGLDWIISPSFQYKSTVMSRVYCEIEKRDEKKRRERWNILLDDQFGLVRWSASAVGKTTWWFRLVRPHSVIIWRPLALETAGSGDNEPLIVLTAYILKITILLLLPPPQKNKNRK